MISWRNRGFRADQVYHRSLFLWNQGQIVWRSLFFHCWFLWLVWLWWWRHHLTISRKKRKSSAESVVTMYVLYYANRSTFTWRQNYKRRCPNYIRIKKVRKIEKNNFSKNQKNKFRKKNEIFQIKEEWIFSQWSCPDWQFWRPPCPQNTTYPRTTLATTCPQSTPVRHWPISKLRNTHQN